MSARYLSHLATLLAVLSLGLAGCGGDDGGDGGSDSDKPQGDEAEITAVMEQELDASNAKDAKAYCALILEQYRSFGDCPQVVKARFAERGEMERTIKKVEVDGDSATVVAEVTLSARGGESVTERTILRRENGVWRLDSYVLDN